MPRPDLFNIDQASSDLQLKQVEHLYANVVRAPVINIVNAVVLSFVLWPVTQRQHIIVWFLALLALNVGRMGLGWLYQRTKRSPEESHHWIRPYVIGAILSGAVWGSAALLMPPNHFEYQVLVILMVGGMVLGGLPMLAVTDNAFSYYLFAATVPISAKMFSMGSLVPTLVGALVLLFMFTTYATGKHFYKTFRAAFLSRIAAEAMARHDPLTGLANRRWFDECLRQAWNYALRGSFPLSLILIDVDEFKKYNDRYGHLQGDECLRRVADALRLSLPRKTDLLARYGGEEFVVLLPFTDAKGGALVAERLRNAVSKLEMGDAASTVGTQLTVSLGGATCLPKPSASPTEPIHVADQALYAAKAAGKNCCIWKNPAESRAV